MSTGSTATATVADLHAAIMQSRRQERSASRQMAALLTTDKHHVVLTGDGTATIYLRTEDANGKTHLQDFDASVTDARPQPPQPAPATVAKGE